MCVTGAYRKTSPIISDETYCTLSPPSPPSPCLSSPSSLSSLSPLSSFSYLFSFSFSLVTQLKESTSRIQALVSQL